MWESKYSKGFQLSATEKDVLNHFVQTALERIRTVNFTANSWKFHSIASDCGIVLSNLHNGLVAALWIEFLDMTRRLVPPLDFKYRCLNDFLYAYEDVSSFSVYGTDDQSTLMDIANWMNVFFTFETAKKNKGLVMDVIPRLVEGPNVRYVTGSGQTRATADRVLIYEKEGGVKPSVRNKRRKIKSTDDDDLPRDSAHPTTKRGPKLRKTLPLAMNGIDSMAERCIQQEEMTITIPPTKIETTFEPGPHDFTDVDNSDNEMDSLSELSLDRETARQAVDTAYSSKYPILVNLDFAPQDYYIAVSFLREVLRDDVDTSNDFTGVDKYDESAHFRSIISMPRLSRQVTDRVALLELLEEVEGAPVVIESKLDPLMFSHSYIKRKYNFDEDN